MSVTTVNISFQTDLLKKIDKAADEEDRSRSGITNRDVAEEIKAYRDGE
jgi:metal-responsive CopG/Arc/MetJ family transcriptional regulator